MNELGDERRERFWDRAFIVGEWIFIGAFVGALYYYVLWPYVVQPAQSLFK
jgi:hypothetical protein